MPYNRRSGFDYNNPLYMPLMVCIMLLGSFIMYFHGFTDNVYMKVFINIFESLGYIFEASIIAIISCILLYILELYYEFIHDNIKDNFDRAFMYMRLFAIYFILLVVLNNFVFMLLCIYALLLIIYYLPSCKSCGFIFNRETQFKKGYCLKCYNKNKEEWRNSHIDDIIQLNKEQLEKMEENKQSNWCKHWDIIENECMITLDPNDKSNQYAECNGYLEKCINEKYKIGGE